MASHAPIKFARVFLGSDYIMLCKMIAFIDEHFATRDLVPPHHGEKSQWASCPTRAFGHFMHFVIPTHILCVTSCLPFDVGAAKLGWYYTTKSYQIGMTHGIRPGKVALSWEQRSAHCAQLKHGYSGDMQTSGTVLGTALN